MAEKIFREYDKGELDAQYFLRGAVADFQDWFDHYMSESLKAREEFGGYLDINYGSSVGEALDIFSPKGASKAPVHVFIHGGYWQSMDKKDFNFVAAGMVPQGAIAVIINYTLAPEVSMTEIVKQNRVALAWIWRHIAEYGGDPDKIHVSGHSAGGHLTAMMALTDWPEFENGLPKNLIKSGLCISGLFELEPVRLCYLNDVLGMNANEAMAMSPSLMEPPAGLPQVITVGANETDEFLRQSTDYATLLKSRGVASKLMSPIGLDHFSIVAQLGDAQSDLTIVACELMGL